MLQRLAAALPHACPMNDRPAFLALSAHKQGQLQSPMPAWKMQAYYCLRFCISCHQQCSLAEGSDVC